MVACFSGSHAFQYVEDSLKEVQDRLGRLHTSVQSLALQQQHLINYRKTHRSATSRDLYLVVVVMILCQIALWLTWKK